jgi:hypothetical protein
VTFNQFLSHAGMMPSEGNYPSKRLTKLPESTGLSPLWRSNYERIKADLAAANPNLTKKK